MFTITCESSADLSKELYEKYDIKVIPFTIMVNGEERKDGVNVTLPELYESVAKTNELPKTAAINSMEYKEFWDANANPEGIIHFSISSKVSLACSNATAAASEMENVHVIDTQSLSTGIGLQVLYACKLRDEGDSIEEVVEKVKARVNQVQISFVIEKLNFLHKGGRCSSLQLLGANILGIRPSIAMKDGTLGMHRKYKGKMNKVVGDYLKDTITEFNNIDDSMCFITYSTATPEMLDVARDFLANNVGFKNVFYTNAGCTVGTHCGPNTLGIIYYNGKEA